MKTAEIQVVILSRCALVKLLAGLLPYFATVLVFVSLACADSVNLGVFSFDTAFLPSRNNVTISSFTGADALPPDFPVVMGVAFTSISVILTPPRGQSDTVQAGEAGPGSTIDPLLVFPDTSAFVSAKFKATLVSLFLSPADGRKLVADSGNIDAVVLPGSGQQLIPGSDFVVLNVTAHSTAVPEPATGCYSCRSLR